MAYIDAPRRRIYQRLRWLRRRTIELPPKWLPAATNVVILSLGSPAKSRGFYFNVPGCNAGLPVVFDTLLSSSALVGLPGFFVFAPVVEGLSLASFFGGTIETPVPEFCATENE